MMVLGSMNKRSDSGFDKEKNGNRIQTYASNFVEMETLVMELGQGTDHGNCVGAEMVSQTVITDTRLHWMQHWMAVDTDRNERK